MSEWTTIVTLVKQQSKQIQVLQEQVHIQQQDIQRLHKVTPIIHKVAALIHKVVPTNDNAIPMNINKQCDSLKHFPFNQFKEDACFPKNVIR